MKTKIVKNLPVILLGLIFIMLIFLNVLYQDHWLDSDMAAEMMFAEILAEEGRLFATPNWYYSTEFRFLYTHLLMGPLFTIFESWHVIRTITNIVFYGLLLCSYFYCIKPLKISKSFAVLTSCILLLPFSETMMTHMQMGNTYMSHVIIIYFFFGMFLRLAEGKKNIVLLLFYAALAIVCGISGIRYLLALQCPLVITAFIYWIRTEEFQDFRKRFNWSAEYMKTESRAFCTCREAFYFYYSILGAVASVAGYGVNVVWISKKYVFQTYDATNFIAIYQGELFERLQNAIGCLLMLFGYIPEKGVLSLRGVISIIAFVLVILFTYCARKSFQRDKGMRFFVTLFLIVAFAVNMFVFVFTTSTMVPRYFITVFIFVLPVLAFYLEKEKMVFDKSLVCLLLVGCLALSTAKTVLSFVASDKNAEKRPVAEFLAEEGYHFGFATYNNGNIITEITNGEVEIGNIWNPADLDYFRWSSPMKYYEEDYYEDEVFLLLTNGELAECEDTKAVLNGKKVYEDENYTVLIYDSVTELMGYRKQ